MHSFATVQTDQINKWPLLVWQGLFSANDSDNTNAEQKLIICLQCWYTAD